MSKLTKAKKKKLQGIILVIIATSLVSILMISALLGILDLFQGNINSESKKVNELDFSNITVEKPKINEMLLTKNVNSRPGKMLEAVKGVVVHYTANPGTDATANRNYFESRKDCEDELENKVSSHYVIGLKGQIIQCIPENEIAYASNDRNKDTISIECCHKDASGKFTQETYQSLIKLVSYLCDKYELQNDTIIRHYDVTGKICPKYYVKHPKSWIKLKDDINTHLKENSKQK